MQIQVKEEISKEEFIVYVFNMFDLTAVFVGCDKQFKPLGKRIWKTETLWDKYNSRDNKISEPELTQIIKDKVKEEIINKLSVKNWNDWENKR